MRDPLITEESGKALLPGKGMAYVQGFHAIAVGAVEPGWGIDLGALAGIWRAGCIILAEHDRLGSHT
ncbi:hypothetical protein [Brevibacterium sp. JSBI002]|uniref:hypothetical protein n=1 Tax=Brevibacterium sp. JSBI002 TaxID=2886045 RepID=UPI0029FF2A59|nr:hypothetical protein [Brevibacterium sp. JSBI002]